MLKLGIIGTGRIAERFMNTAVDGRDIKVVCVYNPNIEGSEKFAERHGIAYACQSLDEMCEKVDGVYVASPHETHYQYVKTLLNNGVNVLCEKPMSLKKSDILELQNLSREKGLVLMEAVKTAYCPGFNELIRIAQSGRIGTVVDVEASFTRLTPMTTREYLNPVCNGSFMELGSYVLLPVMRLMGSDYRSVHFNSLRAYNGVDTYTKAQIECANGMATVKTGIGAKSEGQLLVTGTKGYILARSPWWMTKHFEVRYEDPNKIETYDFPYESSGLQYELDEFIKRIQMNTQEKMTEEAWESESSENEAWESESIGVSREESMGMADIMEKFIDWNTPELEEIRQSNRVRLEEIKKENKGVKVWAHRGCCYRYPENTLESFEAAAKIPGITGIELDVQFTKDKEIVVFHDENVKRVTDGDRNVCEYTLAEIKELKIKSNKDAQGNETYTTIPTLREVLTLLKPYCEKNGLLINIELKTSVIRYEGIEEKTMKLVEEMGMKDYIVYSSFLRDSVALVKMLDPGAKTGMLDMDIYDCIEGMVMTNADAIHPYIGSLIYELPRDMNDIPVRVWNIEEPFFNNDDRPLKDWKWDEYVLCGVTDIITNVPERYLVDKV